MMFKSSKLFVKVKDDQIEELTREIQMYYGIKRHIEELTKENQAILLYQKYSRILNIL